MEQAQYFSEVMNTFLPAEKTMMIVGGGGLLLSMYIYMYINIYNYIALRTISLTFPANIAGVLLLNIDYFHTTSG